MTASEDLKFFANRLQGVMSLIPVMEETESLENHKKELEAQVERQKTLVEDLKQQIEWSKRELADWQKQVNELAAEAISYQNQAKALMQGLSALKRKFSGD